MRFNIDIAFRDLGNNTSLTDSFMKRSKHWLLVVTGPDGQTIIELKKSNNEKIYFHNGPSTSTPDTTYPVAAYVGERSDFDLVLSHHPMNKNSNDGVDINNCQHFVATFLVFLKRLPSLDPVGTSNPRRCMQKCSRC